MALITRCSTSYATLSIASTSCSSTSIRRSAGLIAGEPGPEEAYFGRRFADLLHVDDRRRLSAMRVAGSDDTAPPVTDPMVARCLQMLAYQVDGMHSQVGTFEAFVARVREEPAIGAELAELADLLEARSTFATRPVPGLEDTPLCLHAAYGIREVLTAVGWLSATRRTPFQAGTLPLADRSAELLFVTLDKRNGYHERIAYRDYAISADRFHWQSQNSAGPDTNAGRRYLESPGNGWQFQLFVRERRGQPYRACGPVTLESSTGSRPMSIVWRMTVPLPARLFRAFSVLRGV